MDAQPLFDLNYPILTPCLLVLFTFTLNAIIFNYDETLEIIDSILDIIHYNSRKTKDKTKGFDTFMKETLKLLIDYDNIKAQKKLMYNIARTQGLSATESIDLFLLIDAYELERDAWRIFAKYTFAFSVCAVILSIFFVNYV